MFVILFIHNWSHLKFYLGATYRRLGVEVSGSLYILNELLTFGAGVAMCSSIAYMREKRRSINERYVP